MDEAKGIVELAKSSEFNAIKDKLEILISSKSLPTHVKNAEIAFTIVQMGKELGFPAMQSFHYIIPIQGKLSLSAKAVGALLRRGGVHFQTIRDGVKLYKNGTEKPSDENDKPTDMVTTIKFFRQGIEEITDFYWSDAVKMNLTTKENWVKMPEKFGHVKLDKLLEHLRAA